MSRAGILHLAQGLTAPLHAATGTFGIVGQRGTGKSTSAAVLVEQLVGAGGRAVVADPTGVWWGLAHPGRGAGLPAIIFGGEHGDVPLEETGGQLVADVVLGGGQSVYVLDLKLLRKGQQIRFMAEFCEALYHGNRDALHVVIDEAGRFAPQVLREPGGHGARLLGAIEDIVKLGRSRGLGCTLIEQRPAHINKSVFEQIETLFAFRLMGPNDRKAIHGWIEAQGDPAREREVMDGMAKLKTGQALVWSPALLEVFGVKTFHLAETFDSRATPKVGTAARAPKKRAAVDLAALREQMTATIERAKANDPKALRARVAQLERELAAKPAAAAPKVERVEVPVVSEAKLERLERELQRIHGEVEVAAHTLNAWKTLYQSRRLATMPPAEIGNGTEVIVRQGGLLQQAIERSSERMKGHMESAVAGVVARAARPSSDGQAAVGTGGLRRIMIALAQRPHGLSTRQLGVRAQLSSRSGTFDTYLSRARQQGWIEGTRDRLRITDAGVAVLGEFEALPEGRQLLGHWLNELGQSGAGRMLRALAGAYPRTLAAAELGSAVGLSPGSGTFDTYLSRLRSLELISGDRGALTASAEFFEGRS